jgi:hypothetical protein
MRSDEKTREMRLRYKALRQHLSLRKSRRRDPDSTEFGVYWLLDVKGRPMLETRELDEIENYLTKKRSTV